MDEQSATAPAVGTDDSKVPGANQTDAGASLRPDGVVESSDKQRTLTDLALDFLSNASNETLAACGIGLCGLTYLVFGRVGLVLIGVFCGIILQATWVDPDEDGNGTRSGLLKGGTRRKELGIEVAKRVLDWTDARGDLTNGTKGGDIRPEALFERGRLDYSGFKPATGAALNSLTDAIIRDYVEYVWSSLRCAPRPY